MKTKKIVGLLVALGGMVASFAAAAALYVKKFEDAGFGIGASYHSQDGTINYLIAGKTSGTITPKYLTDGGENNGQHYGDVNDENKVYNQAEFEFPLSAQFTKNKQPYVQGNFSVSLSNISELIRDHASIWVELKGFGDSYYSENAEHLPNNAILWGASGANTKFMDDDVTLTGATYSVDKDIAVLTDGGLSVCVYVKINEAYLLEHSMDLAESTPFSISVEWKKPSDAYEYAYVIGDGNGWNIDELYTMVPNLQSTVSNGYEWYFEGVTGFTLGKAILDKHGDTPDVWSTDPNESLESDKTYSCTWKGVVNNEAQHAYFSL